MFTLGLLWALIAIGLALVVAPAIRRADEVDETDAWLEFCRAHGLTDPSGDESRVGI